MAQMQRAGGAFTGEDTIALRMACHVGAELLAALASRVASLAPAGEPRRRLNNTLSGFASLPLTLRG